MNSSVSPENDQKATQDKAVPAQLQLDRPVVLVGMMGAGKSTVGRLLAETLNLPFFDSDDEIEAAADMSVSDIFATHGEDEFRRVERRVIERLVSGEVLVLATGGGAFMNEDTRRMLNEKTRTVWLRADLELLWRRVSRRGGRPLLQQPNPKQVLQELLEAREPVYAQASLVVDSLDGPHIHTVNAILEALNA